MKALITGSNYLSGRSLLAELSYFGNSVAGIVVDEQNTDAAFHSDLLNPEKIREIVELVQPDVLFHFASSLHSSISEELLQQDIERTRNIIEVAGKVRVIFISSPEVYGIQKVQPVKEDASCNPSTPLGVSLKEQEELVREYCNKGRNILIARVFSPALFSDFCRQLSLVERGKESKIQISTGYVIRDVVDDRDSAKALVLLAQKGQIGEIYNLCTGKGALLKEARRQLLSFSSAKSELIENKELPQEVSIVGDSSKLTSITGWHPRTPLRQTLQEVLDFWRSKV